MTQANFYYRNAAETHRTTAGVSIFADDPAAIARLAEEADFAGCEVFGQEPIRLPDATIGTPLGDIVLVQCMDTGGAVPAMLTWLDEAAAYRGSRVIVFTCCDALDDVFACFDRSGADILVDAGEGERAVALGRALGQAADARVREISGEDRLSLIRLTEQVEDMARKLDALGMRGSAADGGAFRFESPTEDFKGEDRAEKQLIRKPKPPLPDPRLVRQVIAQRQLRGEFFDARLFADPAWDILLDLTAARGERKRVSVTSLCIAASVPPTTGLRWIGQMVEAGLLVRVEDDIDRRRAFLELSEAAAEAMARYFAALSGKAAMAL